MRTFMLSILLVISFSLQAQPWVQQNSVFNPSGVPSLPFSQPRFADVDADGDMDMLIGSTASKPFFVENTGTPTVPNFSPGDDILPGVDPLDAEVAVFHDLDADGDFDLISGGFTGLNYYTNTGNAGNPVFEHQSGFFNGLATGYFPVPDLADIDNDGDKDLVVGLSENGMIRLYFNLGNSSSAIFSEAQSVDVYDVGLYAYPAFNDLDNDGDYDLIAGRDGHNLWYLKNTGSAIQASWELNSSFFGEIANDTYWNSPGFADLNNDGTADLVYGTADGPLVCYFNSGTPEIPAWTIQTSLFGGVLDPGAASNPFLIDFDNDGDLDLLSGSQMGTIHYFENTGNAAGAAWQENSAYFASIDHSIYSAVTAGDVNGDGLPDVIVGDLSGKLYFYQNTPDGLQWITDVFQDIQLSGWSAPRLFDIDLDGDLDLIAGEENGKLSLIKNAGNAQQAIWFHYPNFFGNFDIGSNCVPAPVDLDFDGDTDLLCGGGFGDLVFLQNNNGNYVQNNLFIIGLDGNQNATPCFGDLDNDGDPDLVLGEYSGVFGYFRNDYLFVGIEDNKPAPKTRFSIFPNPVAGVLNLSVYSDSDSEVRMRVFDVEGKLVTDWDKLLLVSGSNEFRLPASTLLPGVYLLKIIQKGEVKVFRLIKR